MKNKKILTNYFADNKNIITLSYENSKNPTNMDYFRALKEYINELNEMNDDQIEKTNFQEKYIEFIKSKVSNFLNLNNTLSYDHIVLLTGAGASIVADNSNYGKSMGQLAKEILNKIRTKRGNKLLTFNQLMDFLPDLNRKDFGGNNILEWEKAFPLEELISKLDFYINGNKDLCKSLNDKEKIDFFNKVVKTRKFIIQNIFEAVNYEFSDDKTEFPFNHTAVILDLIKMLHDKSQKLTIVTTNYDIAIEKALEKNNFTIFDGFNLSDNSIFDNSSYDWILSKKVENINSNERIYKPNMVNLLKIHGSINWIYNQKNTIKVSADEVKTILNNSDMTSEDVRMIFPSTNKYMQSYEEPYFDLISRFQTELHKQNVLLVTSGFSFGDDHISRMIINAIKQNPSLKCLITDYNINLSKYNENINFDSSDESKFGNKNWQELDDLRNQGYDIAFLKATMNDKIKGLAYYLRG